MYVATNIRHLRSKRKFSQSDLALKLKITRQQVANYESGSSTIPLSQILSMSTIFNISIDDFVKRDLTKYKPSGGVTLIASEEKAEYVAGISPSVQVTVLEARLDECRRAYDKLIDSIEIKKSDDVDQSQKAG